MATVDTEVLSLLLKASSKDFVAKLCNEAFLYRDTVVIPEALIQKTSEGLSIEVQESKNLLNHLSILTKKAVFQGQTEPAAVLKVFPDGFHKNLRDLLAKIIIENLPMWKNHAINNQVSLPRLLDFDWRVDIKTSSDSISRMSVPTCIMQLKVQENSTKIDSVPEVTSMNVELSKETLDTMLDGLGKIRDQLSSVASKGKK
ncbi:COMM domain-containing protein 9-like [Lingula anatina]|uniref:COMM domain-containing protein 9-like n=1 Tax=Lingula anatina TaxID=7574 RepID=A0A1S3JCN9_LINAN|nr:COMM domain-containing protein 9-like [Lingula anatina]|eukprot:XP_013408180.1 COMM domain-containing protein 9-like [Lingula anatina]